MLIIVLILVFAYFQKGPLRQEGKIRVTTSFYPLADFASKVGGNKVEVYNINPPGSEPHDYEPTPRDLAQIYDSQLFLYNGNGLDPWAEKVAEDLKSRDVTVIRMSVELNSPEGDPHFWLDPSNASSEADVILKALMEIDPLSSEKYVENTIRFTQALINLDLEYQKGLSSCSSREMLVSHNAFNYLAKRYNLSSLYLTGISPEDEPSPQKMAEITEMAKNKQIKYVFFETLIGPDLAETIANEIGAQTLVLNPIEGLRQEEIDEGKDYISLMRENLNNLRIGLQCL